MQGRSLGTTTITVQAPGYNNATLNVTVNPSGFTFQNGTNNFSTTTFSANTTLGIVSALLDPTTHNYASNQPLRGGYPNVTVDVTSTNPSVGTIVNSPVVFTGGGASGQTVQFDPAAAGTTTLSLVPPAGFTTPSNLQQATATVTAPNISVSGTGVVGLDLQTSISVTLGASPPSRRDVTLTSNNPAIATITTDPLVAGAATLTFTNVPATLPGTTVGTFYVQGRSLGTTTITVQAPGYNDATMTVTVTPSGFSFVNGTSNFTTTAGAANRNLGVQAVRLDPTFLNVAAAQALRGGYGPVGLAVTSSNTIVGTIVSSPAVFGSGDSSKTVQFDPASVGTTIISIVPPAGFTTPSNLQQITATVNP